MLIKIDPLTKELFFTALMWFFRKTGT